MSRAPFVTRSPQRLVLLVSGAQVDQANALEGVTYGLASLVGAGLAGLAVATVGPVPVVTFDAASYLVMALCLWSVGALPAPARAVPAHPAVRSGGAGFGPLLRLAVTDPVLRDTTVMFALFNISDGALLVFLPHRAVQLGLGSGGYGYLVAATTAGELVAAALLSRYAWRAPLRASILVAQATAAATILLLLVGSTAVTVAALVALGMCASPMTAWAQSLRMRLVPAHSHGRLFALLRTTMQATPPAGAGLAALTHGSLIASVTAMAAIMGLPAALLAADLLSAPTNADSSTADLA